MQITPANPSLIPVRPGGEQTVRALVPAAAPADTRDEPSQAANQRVQARRRPVDQPELALAFGHLQQDQRAPRQAQKAIQAYAALAESEQRRELQQLLGIDEYA